MIIAQSTRRRALVIAGLLALISGAAGAVALPIFDWRRSIETELATAGAEYKRLSESLDALTVRKRRLTETGGQLALWQARQTGEATARVQSVVTELARASGANLRALGPGPSHEFGLVQAVSLRLESEATLDQLSALLQKLEFHAPPLLVETATLRRLNRPGHATEQPLLFVQIDILAPVNLSEESE
ncbi:type II secretion system protein GspM [Defluviimonas salinarum]|uniref:Type II secretion system protein GspM n=1 Tax=Defluviimonas salinarum TaxID=2992147 RepID=A0ABT3J776_9RHOB|nr:type II secretion system protein GspM [Defluviimonas salinarum]MCW3783543.1 type II secretion system protein GspM [Defluviimonas salinarum]